MGSENNATGMTADEFKEIQKRLGLPNYALAKELQVTVSTIDKWRAGDRPITPQMQRAIELLIESRARALLELTESASDVG